MENGKQGAFACPDNGTEYFTTWQGQVGLTKREYFAGLAMQGIMASLTEMRANRASTLHYTGMDEDISREAVSISDALLKELDKPKSE